MPVEVLINQSGRLSQQVKHAGVVCVSQWAVGGLAAATGTIMVWYKSCVFLASLPLPAPFPRSLPLPTPSRPSSLVAQQRDIDVASKQTH